MTLNKFCPVAQGEYYNIKSPAKSQPFFPVFSSFFQFFAKFFLLRVQYLHFVITVAYKYKMWINHQKYSLPAEFIPSRKTAYSYSDIFKGTYKNLFQLNSAEGICLVAFLAL